MSLRTTLVILFTVTPLTVIHVIHVTVTQQTCVLIAYETVDVCLGCNDVIATLTNIDVLG